MIFTTTCEKDNPSLLAQLREANKYLPWINEAAQQYSLQPSIIAGLGSRESHWGVALKPEGPEGTGDFAKRKPRPPRRPGPLPPDGLGYGRGVLQVDWDWHEFARTGKWMDPRENILYGCGLLHSLQEEISGRMIKNGMMERFEYNFPPTNIKRLHEWLRIVLAAYNCGASRVFRDLAQEIDVDTHTSGHNYSKDVINRAGWFQLQGWA